MSAIDSLTDGLPVACPPDCRQADRRRGRQGRIALAKGNIGLALDDLCALRARASELGFCDGEWQECVDKAFAEQERLLREALEALR